MAPTPAVEELLSGLTASQRAAVVSEAQPLCIVASAGAGKTRVLTRRIAYRCRTGAADASHTLALTFTRKAAGELQHRLAALGLRDGVAAGTFHSHAAAQLQRWWADRRQSPPTLLDRKSRVLGPLLAERAALTSVPLADVASLIEWAKARTVEPDGLEAALAAAGRSLPTGVSAGALAAVYARYEHEKRRRGLMDFDDLLARCADALESDPEFAGAQRWRWRHVYVDEFQDLNPLQHRLLTAWLGDSVDLCVVGDPNQAIYGWNGADPELLRAMPDRWPTTEVLHLDANHRCTEQIVAAAASVLGPDGTRLRAVGRSGPPPTIRSFETDADEALAIAAAVADARREGRPWGSMAVLTRTNAQLAVLQRALTAAGVPCWSAASAALLDEAPVREFLAALRGRAHQSVRVAVADLRELVAERAATATPEESASLGALADIGEVFHTVRPDASAGDWLAWLPSTAKDRSDSPAAADAVTLSSFHRAKGLEWEEVWVAGAEEGLVPLGRPRSGPAEREERQLLYVALTRAMQVLHVTYARTRSFGGRPVPRQPSRWLSALSDAGALVLDPGAPPDGSASTGDAAGAARSGGAPRGAGEEWRRRLADSRRSLAGAAAGAGSTSRALGRRLPADWPDPDTALVAALRAWRLETARHSGVPPHVLLHDTTLEAMAALRPRTMEDLIAVPGFGAVKANRYGAPLLDILCDRAASA